ncbi:T9SS type B sorting domain-containing protein [Flavobacterium gyeonganense]|uniref:T9SS type B sorting domain-containing protein n=1 Tax=Flavobacterium gyeonganense TaxID=1310418 RepID=A0ABV5HA80_9FLAO|nr:T9SS type B sorting domain-containing protein [Flavobacterium gyeonganense]
MKKTFLLFLFLSGLLCSAQYTSIPDKNFEKALIDLGIDSGPIDRRVLTTNINKITNLDLYGKEISNISGIEDFISLKYLNCDDNELSKVDLSKNTALTELIISANLLTKLDVSKNINLVKLNCLSNQIDNLNVSENLVLTDLNCQHNKLKKLNISNNLALKNLECSYNQLTSLDISKNTSLNSLGCTLNQLTTLNTSNNINLTEFICYRNQLTSLDVSKNLNLTQFLCNANLITNLDLSKNIKLNILDCSNNKLTSLNLKNGHNGLIQILNTKSNPEITCIQVDNAIYSNTSWSVFKDASASYLSNCNIINSTAPVLTAAGNQLYCTNTDINIVTDFSISHDISETGTRAVYIQISSGYAAGFDKLKLSNPSLHSNITESWDDASGKLTLSSPTGIDVLYSDFVAAVKNVIFSNPSATASGTKTFSITIGQANYLPSTGHFYQFVPNVGITWTQAKAAAENSTYYGLKGYLTTISAADEAKLSGEQASGAGWIGGSDAETEGIWKWVTGPEGLANNGTGTIFWNGLSNGITPNFAFWNNNEPNQLGDEDYAHITAPNIGISGSWNDLSNTGSLDPGNSYQPKGYIVEYGGMPGEYPLKIAASTQITIPEATITTPGQICDSGSLTLYAASNTGTVKWYDAQSGGNLLATGNTFTTPIINTTTTYYADAGCETNRKTVTVSVNKTPDTPALISTVYRCGTGAVTLQATSNIGVINWFTNPTGGTSVYTGTNFTTPGISVNTTYYAEASDGSCINSNRTAANIIVYTPPVVNNEEIVLCENQTILLDAKISGMIYKWSTGQTTQTIEVKTKGTYTVDVTSPNPENCTSTKNINVIEHKKPIIKNIDVNNTTITINLINQADYFEYSVDGVNYQTSNTFYDIPGGLQTAYVKAKDNLCNLNQVTQTFIILVFPAFFTPNNDLHNDFWEVTGIENYPQAQVTIFDRYGNLLAVLSGDKLSWDGNFNKIPLPASDYWYVLKINDKNPLFKGHFSLKR